MMKAARFFHTLTDRLGALLPQRRNLLWGEYLDLSQALNRMTDAHTAAQRRITELERAREQDRETIEHLNRRLGYEQAFSNRLSRQERADCIRPGQILLCAEGTYRGEVASVERDQDGRMELSVSSGFGILAAPSEMVTVWDV